MKLLSTIKKMVVRKEDKKNEIDILADYTSELMRKNQMKITMIEKKIAGC